MIASSMTDTLFFLLAAVAVGSAGGGVLRFFVSGLVARHVGEIFPWGTMVVNVSGALLLGALAGAADAGRLAGEGGVLWALAATGVFGGYTTVSSLSLQSLMLLRDGERWRAAGNLALTLVLGLAAIAGGYTAGAAWASAAG